MKKAFFIAGFTLLACISSFAQNYISGTVSLHGDNTAGGSTLVAPGASFILNKNKLYAQAGFINLGDSTAISADSGTLVMSGTGSQGISGRFRISGLQVSNNAGVSISNVIPVTMVTILDSVTFGNVNNGTLNAGDSLMTLRSNASNTAHIGDLTNNATNSGNRISGSVVAERFVNNRRARAWHLLAPPTTGDSANDHTIQAAWQEGVRAPRGQIVNPTLGYGTVITRPGSDPATATGYDDGITGSSAYSLKIYNSNGALTSPANTDLTHFSAHAGYFLFVRGDRSVGPELQTGSNLTPPTITTLRSKGALHNGDVIDTVTKALGTYAGVANPYASTIDFSKVILNGIANGFYTWDPSINSYGAWVYIDGTAGYAATPAAPGGTYTNPATNALIQSGQAFLVKPTGSSGTVTFKELCKNITSRVDVFRAVTPPAVNVSLFSKDSIPMFLDGTTTVFDDDFSREVYPDEDITKPGNVSENISFFATGKYLMKEKWPTPVNGDTLFLRLWRTTAKPYTLSFSMQDMEGAPQAYLVDNYLKSTTAVQLSGTTNYDFTITGDTASAAINRFAVVFGSKVLPVSLTRIRADWDGTSVNVQWTVQNEAGIVYYEIEHSADGVSFTKAGTMQARGSAAAEVYHFVDAQPVDGDNFYRVKSIKQDGSYTYTSIAAVAVPSGKTLITIYPNPVKNRAIKLWFKNEKAGRYQVNIYSTDGKAVVSETVTHAGGTAVYTLPAGTVAQGLYRAVISDESHIAAQIPVIIE